VPKKGQPDAPPDMHVYRNIYTSSSRSSVKTTEEGSWVSDDPIAHKNKYALLDFRDFVERNHLPLVIVLIMVGPINDLRKGGGLNTEYYRKVRDPLNDKWIRFVDLTLRIHARG